MITKDRTVTIDHDLIIGHTYEVAVRAIAADGKMEAVEVAPRAVIMLVGDEVAPMAPSALTATPFLYTIFLTWTNPTDSDFDVTEIWRNTVDVRATATKVGEMRTDSFADDIGASGVTEYYWIRSRDTSGNLSEWNAVAGVGATTTQVEATDIADFAVTATKMFTNTIILTGDSWSNNSPSAGKIAWNQHTLVHNGVSYTIAAGNTNLKYVYWVFPEAAYYASATHLSMGTTGFMVATNEAGVAQTVWNSSANMVIGTAFILDAAITNAKIGALAVDTANIAALAVGEAQIANLAVSEGKIANLAVTDGKIASLAVDKLTAGTITSKSIVLAVAAGTGDVELRAGIATGDFANTGAATGFIFGLDDSDSDLPKAYFGSPTKFWKWDGAALTVQGLVQTVGGTGQRMVMDNSDNTMRFYNSSNVNVITMDDLIAGSNRPGIFIGSTAGGYLSCSNVALGGSATIYTEVYDGLIDMWNAGTGVVNMVRTARSGASGTGSNFLALNANGVTANLFRGVVNSVEMFNVGYTGIVNCTGGYKYAGTQVVGAQGAAVADATDAASVILRLNDLLARCRAHGLIASA